MRIKILLSLYILYIYIYIYNVCIFENIITNKINISLFGANEKKKKSKKHLNMGFYFLFLNVLCGKYVIHLLLFGIILLLFGLF